MIDTAIIIVAICSRKQLLLLASPQVCEPSVVPGVEPYREPRFSLDDL